MNDRIIIELLELRAHVGVPDEERSKPQRLTVSLAIEPKGGFADLGDRIERTVDYYQVAVAVKEITGSRPRKLLETLAEEIALKLLGRFPLRTVEVELRKYILPDASFTAVRLQRSASQIS